MKNNAKTLLLIFMLMCLLPLGIVICTAWRKFKRVDKRTTNMVLENPCEKKQEINNLNRNTRLNSAESEPTLRKTTPLSAERNAKELGYVPNTHFSPVDGTFMENNSSTKSVFMECNVSNKQAEKQENIQIKDVKYTKNQNINASQELASVPACGLQEKEELIELLECLSKKNPSLALDPRDYNDTYIINTLLVNRNIPVIENLVISSIKAIEEITLWEALLACKEGRSIDIDASHLYSSIQVVIRYPKDLFYIPLIAHALFTYYSSKNMSFVSLSLLQFNFKLNINIFNEFQIFREVKSLMLCRTFIWTSTLNTLKGFNNLKKLRISKVIVLNSGDTATAPSLPKSLKRLIISDIDKKILNWILVGVDLCPNLEDVEISEIDSMDTCALNQLTTLSKLTSFRLRNVVFSGCPDFSFLKQMNILRRLTMWNIFYSYTEKFKVEELNKIKNNLLYLVPDSAEKKILDEYADVVKKNKEVGKSISSINIIVDSKLYNDLGMHKTAPRKNERCAIRIEIINNIDYFGVYSVGLEFTLNDTHCWLDIRIDPETAVDPASLLLDSLQRIRFSFLQIETIRTIHVENSLSIKPKENLIIDMLSDKIINYAKNSKIKSLKLVALVPSVTIDMYKIIMFNNSMPDLENLELSNITFAPDTTEPESIDEKNTLQIYKEHMPKNLNYKSFAFTKRENNLVFSGYS
ncbi:hypothetical protein NEPAR06_0234 [Nematocida parisii]|uniref:Uncharacterized protein n=1 Tax=Nematocida parisii (strain ERTm3) TaxID=935791 RepID=I3ED93_NEMP3|nr:uncharacterized protein NEPG_00636 [Nematocida parisii ERTm1]EIJ87190.1 hypothetical protein NEQG_02525 [Nematocida parisii ERTm3]KAI5126578.1 hypothetical protein NEPAR08_0497 [Nematocida parisii]EIJ95111.1 hypothetical protein NEPG_00636 [Nematocida parisii ERTm1]KAI5142208.1 hypothetical protein NEPAR04_1454 [Nematocida parisii]KAI5146325.1 hypothetical protein NEPAR07_2293 [Nematocida parisii]|eukprot:XP_013058467.1 hypothetical protein NEPG_00636 [Nematocida parisii ERTm1]